MPADSPMEVQVTVLLECSRCGLRREMTKEARDFGGHVWACRRAVIGACNCPGARPNFVTGFAVVETAER
jgi:hypothetical protein